MGENSAMQTKSDRPKKPCTQLPLGKVDAWRWQRMALYTTTLRAQYNKAVYTRGCQKYNSLI